VEEEKNNRIPFEAVKGKIENLVRGFDRTLRKSGESASPSDYSFLVLRMIVRLNENSYRTILYLCADDIDERGDLEFVLSVPALARTILDSVFNVVFLLQDLEPRTKMYMRAGWATIQEEIRKWKDNRGGDPVTDPELLQLQNYYDTMKTDYLITPAEEADPNLIPRFPHPGGMLRRTDIDADRLDFLKLLNNLFYGSFSEDAHMKWPPTMLKGSFFLQPKDDRRDNLDVLRLDYFMKSVIFLITLLSELELGLRCGFSADLKYVWQAFAANSEAAKIYDTRYKNGL